LKFKRLDSGRGHGRRQNSEGFRPAKLFGEIVEVRQGKYSIQVYEDTGGLSPGAPVEASGMPLSVELGPGLMTGIYDGIQRPLDELKARAGDFIVRGADVPALDRTKKWAFKAMVKDGQEVGPGDIVGEVQETEVFLHRIMVPEGVKGRARGFADCEKTLEEPVGYIETENGEVAVTMLQKCAGERRSSRHDVTEVRGAPGAAVRQAPCAGQDARYGPARNRYVFPACEGGHGMRPGPVREREDGGAAPAREVGGRGRGGVRGVRRAGQ